MSDVSELIGKTLIRIDNNNNQELRFYLSENEYYFMTHDQECCEYVRIESIVGDLDDLIGEPILRAEESTNKSYDGEDESGTWTFYKFATRKGYIDIRWLGESNGYYSESVSFGKYEEMI